MSNINQSFYTFYKNGQHTINDPINLAREVVSFVGGSENYARSFMGIYNASGARLVYGYLYRDNNYGTIFIVQFSGELIRVDIVDGEYVKR